jgi:hypothetical protein
MSDPFLKLVAELRVELLDLLREARRTGATRPVAKTVKRTLQAASDGWPSSNRWACSKGCSFCCHNAVSVSAPEAFRLAHEVCALPPDVRAGVTATLALRTRELRGVALPEQARRRTPCALLAPDGTCRAYAARPLPCIGMVSLDVGACESVFRAPGGNVKIPVDRLWFSISGAHNLALRLACRDAGLSATRYELHDALHVALSDPGAEARWLAGEDPFHACRPDPTCTGADAARELDELDARTRG